MKIKVPLVGNIKIGKDAEDQPSIVAIEAPKATKSEKVYEVIGGLVDMSSIKLSNEKTISSKLLEANKEWVYRNNDVIAQEVSQIEFELFSVDIRGGEIEFNKIDDHPLLDILDKFNSRTTKSDGLYITQSHKKLTGDAFWWLEKNGSTVTGIHILPPDKIELVLADPTAGGDLIKEYLYVDTIDGKRVERRFAIDEVIHFKKPNPKNPFRGYGAVEAIADTIDVDALTNETQRAFFEKGAITNFVLTSDAKITQDQLKRLRAELKAMYSGSKNAFTTMIFGNGLKPSPIGFSNKEMEFIPLLEWYRDKIMIGFGNTKSSIGIIDDVNRASFEGSHVGWLRGTVKPDMDSIVNTINEFLVPMFGENLVVGYVDPIPADITEDMKEAVELKKAGIIQINEARDMVGLDAIEGGDVFAPDGDVNYPGKPEEQTVTQTPKEDAKVPKEPKKATIPASLKHLKIENLLRSRGVYFRLKVNKQLKEDAKKIFAKSIAKKNAKTTSTAVVKEETNTITPQFSDSTINAYMAKQTSIEDTIEAQFREKVQRLLDQVKDQTLSNFENDIKSVKGLKKFIKKELFNEEMLKVEAQLDLTPLLMAELVMAGQEAFRLMGIEDTYVPFNAQPAVRSMVDQFADSMLATDKKVLTQIIEDGINSGSSITEIRENISSKFTQYSKVQAERIARTETSRVSNLAAEDAFIQSGVVEAKQWLVANDCKDECLEHSGKIVKLKKNFYTPDKSGFQNGNPPLHVMCRCKLIPVVEGAKAYEPDHSKLLQEQAEKINDLLSQIDKRTKAFKDLKKEYSIKKADDATYIKALEKHLGVSDEQ